MNRTSYPISLTDGQGQRLAPVLPAVTAIARQRLADTPVAARVEVMAGDFFHDALPDGHDVILVANVVNTFTPERNLALLRRLRERTAPGGRLLLLGFWTDVTRTRPPFATLMAGNFLMAAGEGEAHNVDEIKGWLADTGWQLVEQAALTGASTLLVAEAVS